MRRRLFVNGRFLERKQGAVNQVALELTKALHTCLNDNDVDWDMQIVVPPNLEYQAKNTGIPFSTLGSLSGIAWEQLFLPRIRHKGVVLGFFNTVPLWGSGYVTLLHDAHVFTTPLSYGRGRRWWMQILSHRAGTDGNCVLTVSAASARQLMDLGVVRTQHVGITPNGLGNVAHVEQDVSILAKLHLDHERPWCLAQANALPHKNIEFLFEVFRQAPLADMPLVLFGHSTRAEFIAKGHAPPDNAVFAGFVSDGELAALYANALAICIPSIEEGFGLPALEGMALGAVPVVAFRGALPEIVGDAGLILPHNDPLAWVEAIVTLAADPSARNGYIARGRERAAQFTWDATVRRLLAYLGTWFPK